MEFERLTIADVLLIKPRVLGDSRGYFMETYRRDLLEQACGHRVEFVQENQSRSSRGVIRGLHYQLPPAAQSKLVRVLHGRVLDIAVDIRQGSPSFGQHVAAELSEENQQQLFIPRGFAHGFQVLSDSATFFYQVDNYYNPAAERSIRFDDEELQLPWQNVESTSVSERDRNAPLLNEQTDLMNYNEDFYA